MIFAFIDEILAAILSLFSFSFASADEKLSEHYSLSDLTVTQRKELQDTPSQFAQTNLRQVAALLELLRNVGFNFRVTSAYRSPALNAAVGGVHGSAHLEGRAVDLMSEEKQALASYVRQFPQIEEVIVYDQHIHIAIRKAAIFA